MTDLNRCAHCGHAEGEHDDFAGCVGCLEDHEAEPCDAFEEAEP